MRIETLAYSALFLLLAAAVVRYKRRLFFENERSLTAGLMNTYGDDVRARLRDAVERRESQLRFDSRIVWALSGTLVLVSILGLSNVLGPGLVAGLAISAYSVALALHFSHTKRDVEGPRVASLATRSAGSLVHWWQVILVLGAWTVAATGVVLLHDVWAGLLATFVVVVLVVACFRAAQAPAVLDGFHITDNILDRKIRAMRIRQMLMFSTFLPLVILTADSLSLAPPVGESPWFGFFMVVWYTLMPFWNRAQVSDITPAEVSMILDDNGAAA